MQSFKIKSDLKNTVCYINNYTLTITASVLNTFTSHNINVRLKTSENNRIFYYGERLLLFVKV